MREYKIRYNISLVRFINHELTYSKRNKVFSGVYMIDDVYIGASLNMKRRIKAHICAANRGDSYNKKLVSHLIDKFRNKEVINIRILSNNTDDEFGLIEEYRKKGYPLSNSESYGRSYTQIYNHKSCSIQQS